MFPQTHHHRHQHQISRKTFTAEPILAYADPLIDRQWPRLKTACIHRESVALTSLSALAIYPY